VLLGAGFRICGIVIRRFVPPSGACAFLTLEVPTDKGKRAKLDMVTFDCVVDVGALGEGQTVQVTGSIGSKAVKDKAKQDVQVDGRTLWVPQLVIKAVTVEAAKPKEPPKPGAQLPGDTVDW
jgi:hypothetical protein